MSPNRFIAKHISLPKLMRLSIQKAQFQWVCNFSDCTITDRTKSGNLFVDLFLQKTPPRLGHTPTHWRRIQRRPSLSPHTNIHWRTYFNYCAYVCSVCHLYHLRSRFRACLGFISKTHSHTHTHTYRPIKNTHVYIVSLGQPAQWWRWDCISPNLNQTIYTTSTFLVHFWPL